MAPNETHDVPLAFIAVRATGPDPAVDDITEIAVARATSRRALLFVAKILPTRLESAEGIDTPASAIPVAQALGVAREMTRGCAMVAFDAAATRSMLDGACDFWRVPRLEFDIRRLDVRSLAWPEMPFARSLAEVCAALGVEGPSGSAASEVRALADVYRELVEVAS